MKRNIIEKFIDSLCKVPTWVWGLVILAWALGMRIWYLSEPSLIWWDESVYIGMGKYIFSGGMLGMFESFRPLVWPTVLGMFWKAGISPHDAGAVIVSIASLNIIWMSFLIGERFKRYAGVVASFIVASSATFFMFSRVPVTDLLSASIAITAVWLMLRGNWLSAGIISGIAFLTRFPHGIVFGCIILYAIIMAATTKDWKSFARKAVLATLGFSILVIPFLIYNIVRYGDALLPMKLGREILEFSTLNYDPFFYVTALIKESGYFYLAFLPLIAIPFSKRLGIHRGVIFISSLFLISLVYYSRILHKEERYMLSFLAYGAILSGFAFSWIVHKFNSKTLGVILAVMIAWTLYGNQYSLFWQHLPNQKALAPFERFQNFFIDKPGKIVVASYPMIAGVSDVRVVEVTDSLPNMLEAIKRRGTDPDYYTYNSCLLPCQGDNCKSVQSELDTKLSLISKKVFSEEAEGNCNLIIYEVKK